MSTYITLTEVASLYPVVSDFTETQQNEALEKSYGLVNAYINSAIVIPAISDSGDIPEILKIAQLGFLRWILETSNAGYTEELQKLYDNTAKLVSGITQNEVTLPGVQVFSNQTGWHIENFACGISGSFVEVSGTPPTYKRRYTCTITTGGYSESVVYDIYRSDSSSVLENHSGTYDEYETIDDSFAIRFDGQFATGSFDIVGIPVSNANSIEPVKSIRQLTIRL